MKFLQVISDQDLGDLDGIERSALAQVVGNDPEIDPVGRLNDLSGFCRIP